LRFKVDEDLGVTIIRVVDKRTNELIRQFPPEELLNLSKRLKELNEGDSDTSGVLFMKKV
jgi:flagellar protein FlaG